MSRKGGTRRTGKRILPLRDARKIVDCWQNRLRLNNWDIYLAEDTEISSTHGMTYWDRAMCSALIKIKLNPAFLQDETAELKIELTLIHELLHITFCLDNVDNDKTDALIFERALEQTARCLLEGWGSAL